MTDSASSIAQANSDKTSKSSRHITRRFNYVRQAILACDAALYFVNGIYQLADVLTKALTDQASSQKVAIVTSDPHCILSN